MTKHPTKHPTIQHTGPSEQLMVLAIEAAGLGTWSADIQTGVLSLSDTCRMIHGLPEGLKLTLSQSLELVTAEFRPALAARIEAAILEKSMLEYTYQIQPWGTNEKKWIKSSGQARYSEDGSPLFFAGIMQDITSQVLAAQDLQRAEEMFRFSLNAAGMGIWYLHARTREFAPSARVKEIYGFTPAQNPPLSAYLEQIPQPFRDRATEAIETTLLQGAPYQLEHPINLPDGQVRWVSAMGKLHRDTAGDLTSFCGVLLDVTEQKQDDLRKNDFIEIVSHELKSPLTSLKGYVQLLAYRSKQTSDEFLFKTLEKADQKLDKMTTLINGFLDLSQWEAGKIKLQVTSFDMEGLIVEVIQDAEALIGDHQIHFRQTAPCPVIADRDKISQVLTNLLTNAAKYSPQEKPIVITCLLDKEFVAVSVADEGYGISPQERRKVFERHYRTHDTLRKSITGFGIGLYLCSEIIKRHGGTIQVKSEVGKGSVFCYSLPLKARI